MNYFNVRIYTEYCIYNVSDKVEYSSIVIDITDGRVICQ